MSPLFETLTAPLDDPQNLSPFQVYSTSVSNGLILLRRGVGRLLTFTTFYGSPKFRGPPRLCPYFINISQQVSEPIRIAKHV